MGNKPLKYNTRIYSTYYIILTFHKYTYIYFINNVMRIDVCRNEIVVMLYIYTFKTSIVIYSAIVILLCEYF